MPSASSLSIENTLYTPRTSRRHLPTPFDNGVYRMLGAEYLFCMSYHAGVAAGFPLCCLVSSHTITLLLSHCYLHMYLASCSLHLTYLSNTYTLDPSLVFCFLP
jgi:hypothetical protein